jgi:hypothetical protein
MNNAVRFAALRGVLRSARPVLLLAVSILAGCASAPRENLPTPVLSLEACPAAVAPVDAAALAAPHKTLDQMIFLGGVVQARLQYADCAYRNSGRWRDYLLAIGRRLRDGLIAYQGEAAVWQEHYSRLDKHLSDYYRHCLGEPLEDAEYLACDAESAALDAERAQLNAAAVPLQQRNAELTAESTRYRADTADMERGSQQAREDYTQAMQAEARWLGQAYALSISPPVRAYAAKNGCPTVAEPPKTAAEMLALGIGMLDCFGKLSGGP